MLHVGLLLMIGWRAASAAVGTPPVQGPPGPGSRVPPVPRSAPPPIAERVRIERERQKLVDEPIRDGRTGGQFSRREARQMRKASEVLAHTADRYAADGHLSDAEAAELQGRTAAMNGYINAQRSLPPAVRR